VGDEVLADLRTRIRNTRWPRGGAGFDDSLDVVGVHLAGGAFGALPSPSLGVDVAGSGVGCQPRTSDLVCSSLSGGMAQYRGQEGFPVEPVHGCGRVRDHAGRARDGAREGDLPDSFAAAAPPQEVAILPDVELARRDRIVGVALIALLDQDGASRDRSCQQFFRFCPLLRKVHVDPAARERAAAEERHAVRVIPVQVAEQQRAAERLAA
jgi:hypothetical protein